MKTITIKVPDGVQIEVCSSDSSNATDSATCQTCGCAMYWSGEPGCTYKCLQCICASVENQRQWVESEAAKRRAEYKIAERKSVFGGRRFWPNSVVESVLTSQGEAVDVNKVKQCGSAKCQLCGCVMWSESKPTDWGGTSINYWCSSSPCEASREKNDERLAAAVNAQIKKEYEEDLKKPETVKKVQDSLTEFYKKQCDSEQANSSANRGLNKCKICCTVGPDVKRWPYAALLRTHLTTNFYCPTCWESL